MSPLEKARRLRAANLVHVQDVFKSYGDKVVLDNVDLSIPNGEFLSLVGPSGCGKTTLLRLILGQELPDSGTLLIENRPAGLVDSRRGIVYQKYSLYPHLTVLENVMLGHQLTTPLWRRWLVRKEIREEAMQHLSTMGLADDVDKHPHQLSGGMQQRVAIAQALIMKPKILLMDEPFGALDPGARERAQVFLLELWEKHRMTIVFVTHDLIEALYLGTRIVALSQHYTDDRGEGYKRGARVVIDQALSRHALPTEVKSSPELLARAEHIKSVAFKPTHRYHVDQFNLSHPSSFQTLSMAESKNGGVRE
jgi:NitT/TauT family transport system ATP-binding protein